MGRAARIIALIETRLTRQNLLFFAVVFPAFTLALECYVVWSNPANSGRMPIGHDFLAFWSSARLFLTDGLAAVYDLGAQADLQKRYHTGPGLLVWYYPPTWLLANLPLGNLPYGVAVAVFTAVSFAALLLYWRLVRPMDGTFGVAAVIGAPVIIVNLIQGQNGIVTASMLALALTLHWRGYLWPAALVLGLLVIKPHLALLVPVALLAARDHRLFLRTAGVAVGYCLLTGMIVGFDSWSAFVMHLSDAKSIALTEIDLLAQNPSAYAMLTLALVPEPLAIAAQAISALLGIAFIWRLWAGNAEPDLKLAGLMAASLLISPYVFRYDMTFTLAATLLLLRIARRDGYLGGEKLTLAVLWIMPAVFPVIAGAARIQLGFPVLLLALWSVWRRSQYQGLAEPFADGRVKPA